MALFKRRPKTAEQKAKKAQWGIVARVLACAYIVFYVIIPLINQVMEADTEAGEIDETWAIVFICFFIVAVAVILTMAVVETIRKMKTGAFKASFYTDDETNSELGNDAENEEHDDEEDDEEYDEEEDDEYDDEEYDEDEDEDGDEVEDD